MQLQISVDQLRKNKLFIASPQYSGMCSGMYMKACLDLQGMCTQYGMENRFSFIFNESLITRARNYLVDEFLRSGYTHLLFLDADIHFDPKDVIALMALDKDIVGAPYVKKSIKWGSALQAIKRRNVLISEIEKKNEIIGAENLALMAGPNPDHSKLQTALEIPKELTAQEVERTVGDYVFNPVAGTAQFNVGAPLQVMEIGTGYMLIKREVFLKWAKQYPEYSYKPDHVGQAHFDGSRYIHAYFDCIIDRKREIKIVEDLGIRKKGEIVQVGGSDRYLSEDYLFCCSARSMIETEEGRKSIKWIVDNKYSGKVLSLNNDCALEWKNVIGWSARRNGLRGKPETKKTWVKIDTESDNNNKPKVKITADHRVAYFEDILNPVIKFTKAMDVKGYLVRHYDADRKPYPEAKLFNSDQLSVVIGCLLGDGNIGKNSQFSVTHSVKQKQYIKYIQKIIGGVLLEDIPNTGFGVNYYSDRLTLPVNAQIRYLKDIVYVDGVKTIKNIIDLIDEKSLAFWYMDDGSLDKKAASLATYRFTEKDIELLIDLLKDKWGIQSHKDIKTTVYKNEVRKYTGIRMNGEDSDKFFRIVSPYITESMRYKLPVSYWNDNQIQLNREHLGFAASKIKKVVVLKNQQQGKLYDIEVEDNHNFFANGTLVHNCQNWRNMGGEIWLCPWMKTFHVGTYAFQGDMASVAQLVGNL